MKRYNLHTDNMPEPSNFPCAHFFIYENLKYVADSKIAKEQISIGRSRHADLVLNHSDVANIHAFINFKGQQAYLTNRYPGDGLHLNGRAVHIAKLKHEDVIDIGPFALKIKIANDQAAHRSGQQSFSIALVNRYKTDDDMQAAAAKLAKKFKGDPVKTARMIARPEYIIKKDLNKTEAERWLIALRRSGIFCEIRATAPEKPKPEKPKKAREVYRSHPLVPEVQSKSVDPPEPLVYEQIFTPETTVQSRERAKTDATDRGVTTRVPTVETTQDIFDDPTVGFDDDDEEENLWQAPFSLKEKLAGPHRAHPSAMQPSSNLQVIRTIGDHVMDVCYLGKGQKYTLSTGAGKLCLARNNSQESRFVCIAQDFGGYIKNARGETTADLNSFKRSEYLFKKRQRFYRIPVPKNGEIVIQDGQNQYRIFNSPSIPSPAVHVAQRPSEFTWKQWAVSAGIHLVLVLCLSIYWYFQAIVPTPSLPHFVKIDPTLLQQLQPKPKKPPEPPKVEPPPKPEPQPEPQRVAKKVEPPKKQPPKQAAKPVASKRNIKRVAKARRPSRHPQAGGGFGKGNIKNRNINQTGLLSVLEKTPLAGPSTAIASVTNLDVVPVPGAGAGDKNFTVGGVKGSLGNGKIAVASGEMLQTKGSGQVFRSAGAKGPGTVAALQRGSTGNKKVQGMVTAKMSRKVKIQGGMSREMVKRVIDQHMQEISYCYETALLNNPSIMGRIVFEWKIRLDGSVGQVSIVASSINSHDVHNCIKAAIRSWQFPKPMGTEVVVSYPFVFDLVAF